MKISTSRLKKLIREELFYKEFYRPLLREGVVMSFMNPFGTPAKAMKKITKGRTYTEIKQGVTDLLEHWGDEAEDQLRSLLSELPGLGSFVEGLPGFDEESVGFHVSRVRPAIDQMIAWGIPRGLAQNLLTAAQSLLQTLYSPEALASANYTDATFRV